jgi:hypothetical protein
MSSQNPFSAQISRLNSTTKRIGAVVGIILTMWGLLEIGLRINSWRKENQQVKREGRRIRVLVPLLATKKEYLNYMQMEEMKGKRYEDEFEFSIKVSRDVLNTIKAASQNWFSASRSLKQSQVDFYFFPEGNDPDTETYGNALKKALREAAWDKFQVASIIGNVTSTATLEYGKLCGKKSLDIRRDAEVDPERPTLTPMQYPMILPMATAANVPQSLRGVGVPAVLRLPPDNEKQAKLIANLFLRDAEPVLQSVVIRDLSNQIYSRDLVDSFREHYVREPLKAAQEATVILSPDNKKVLGNWGSILSVIPSGGEAGNPPIFFTLEKLKPDAVLIFGMTNVSLETLAQIRVSQEKPRYIILTDGAVDEYLLPRIKNLVNRENLSQLYLTFPLTTPDPPAVAKVTSVLDEDKKRNLDMTHAIYLIDSTHIILTMLEQGIFTDHDNSEAKDIIVKKIKGLYQEAGKGSKDIGIKDIPSQQNYLLDTFGNTTNLEYHLFKVCFPDLPNCTKETWLHADLCPVERMQ